MFLLYGNTQNLDSIKSIDVMGGVGKLFNKVPIIVKIQAHHGSEARASVDKTDVKTMILFDVCVCACVCF